MLSSIPDIAARLRKQLIVQTVAKYISFFKQNFSLYQK